MEIELIVKSQSDGAARNFRFPAEGRLVLGRGPESPVPLEGSALSREHVAFEFEGTAVFVSDLSSNGTWVNGMALARRAHVPVTAADAVEIPGYEITFQFEGMAPAAAPAPERERAPVAEAGAPTALPGALAAAPPPVEAGAIEKLLAPVSRLMASLSGLEKFSILLVLASIGLVVIYVMS